MGAIRDPWFWILLCVSAFLIPISTIFYWPLENWVHRTLPFLPEPQDLPWVFFARMAGVVAGVVAGAVAALYWWVS